MVLGLKRYEHHNLQLDAGFSQGSFSHRQKINTFVDFPLEGLDLQPFLAAGAPVSVQGDDEERVEDQSSGAFPFAPSCMYDLFAVCNHYGRLGFGHYTAMTRYWDASTLSPDWFEYDDDVVRQCEASEVPTESAYVLLYRRRPNRA